MDVVLKTDVIIIYILITRIKKKQKKKTVDKRKHPYYLRQAEFRILEFLLAFDTDVNLILRVLHLTFMF